MIPVICKKNYVPSIYVITLLLIFLNAPTESHSFEIGIDIAPNTINIQSRSRVVTVHTNIKYFDVEHQSVYLNDILINSWKADNRGNFVAKFLMDEVKALADSGDLTIPGDNLLTIVGYTVDASEFTGSQVITVINNVPSGRQ